MPAAHAPSLPSLTMSKLQLKLLKCCLCPCHWYLPPVRNTFQPSMSACYRCCHISTNQGSSRARRRCVAAPGLAVHVMFAMRFVTAVYLAASAGLFVGTPCPCETESGCRPFYCLEDLAGLHVQEPFCCVAIFLVVALCLTDLQYCPAAFTAAQLT